MEFVKINKKIKFNSWHIDWRKSIKNSHTHTHRDRVTRVIPDKLSTQSKGR